MTETKKHTPGPWRIVGVDGYATAIWGPKAEDVVPETSPMLQENARLIAAAPDLLKALRLALPAVAMHTPNGALGWPEDTPMTGETGEDVDLSAIAALLRAAITKAEGD